MGMFVGSRMCCSERFATDVRGFAIGPVRSGQNIVGVWELSGLSQVDAHR